MKNRTLSEDVAVISYKYTKGLKEGLARANLMNSAESILAMLPF
jgi:urease gamma subunit